jgi:hypothetical protein
MAYDLDPSLLIFQHNDPKSTKKNVHQWLRSQKFNVLEWPTQSLNLNLIDHLWAGLKYLSINIKVLQEEFYSCGSVLRNGGLPLHQRSIEGCIRACQRKSRLFKLVQASG